MRKLTGLLAALALASSACSPVTIQTGLPSALNPRGPGAAAIAANWWLMFALGSAVFVLVTVLTVYTIYTRRARGAQEEVLIDAPDGRGWILWGGIVLPVVVLTVVFVFSLQALGALASPAVEPALMVDVTGKQWWWHVRYPDQGFATANEVRIPVGRPVLVRLTSDDVIHSFWVPELTGKLDLNPGDTNSLWIQADEPGEYRGFCAEFCGVQHARMQFVVVAQPQEAFDSWVAAQSQPAAEPQDENLRRGQQVFLSSTCVYCHTVRGTSAAGDVGPDLTHLASRKTLGSGIMQNNRGNLGGWIVDPQHFKPGNLMPTSNLNAADFQVLLDYLGALR